MYCKKKLKVLYLITSSDHGGATTALINILDGLIAWGGIPFVVMAHMGSLCEELNKRNIRFQVIRHFPFVYPDFKSFRDLLLYTPRFIRTIVYNYKAVFILSELVKEIKPDIIHTNIGVDQLGHSVAKKFDIPHVWHIREYQDLDFGLHPFPSKKNFISKVNFTNNYPIAITKDIFEHFKMQNDACVIYDGVTEDCKRGPLVIDKKKYFLFVGRLEEGKGVRLLIEAFKDFCFYNHDYELKIAGLGVANYVKKLQRRVEKAKLTKRIQFLGYRTDVYSLMENAAALIVPSRYEGFGYITIEAMFNGCLVIGNNSGGTKEIIEKENIGILYSGHNALVTAMKSVVNEGIENYYPIIRKAQECATTLYSKGQNINAISSLYVKILEKQNCNVCKD